MKRQTVEVGEEGGNLYEVQQSLNEEIKQRGEKKPTEGKEGRRTRSGGTLF